MYNRSNKWMYLPDFYTTLISDIHLPNVIHWEITEINFQQVSLAVLLTQSG